MATLLANTTRTLQRLAGAGQKLHTSAATASQVVSRDVLGYFNNLELPKNKAIVTYVWIDGTGQHVRGKNKMVDKEPERPEDCPEWNYDGSSTYQAKGGDSDCGLKPVRLFPDPFNPGPHKLLLCETYDAKMKPLATNHRARAAEVFEKAAAKDPWFGIEQEYTFLEKSGWPMGWPDKAFLPPQGPYYCAVGGSKMFGRDIVDSHARSCMYAGIKIGGTNAEVMASQWEYQVGPLAGLEFGDQVWMSRYLLHRIAEMYGVEASFDPKPMTGDWNGAGAHVNFCYTDFRAAPTGVDAMQKAIKKLEASHKVHIAAYDPNQGKDNARRLTGHHETSHIDSFSAGTANRGASIRIPRHVFEKKKGYLEDRRPASNCDPYVVSQMLVKTCILEE